MKEIQVFFTAIMFYTRIPCPKWVNHDATYLNLSTKYFPVIGWIVGFFSWLMYLIFSFLFSVEISIIISMIASILITGAFHEDGLADVCDGFGGGWTKSKILTIMKDSQIGTFGAIGVLLALGLKFIAIRESAITLGWSSLLLLMITAHSLSRLIAAITVYTHEYVRADNSSKVRPVAKKMSLFNFILMIVLGLTPLIVLCIFNETVDFFLLIFPIYFIKVLMQRFFSKWIGGYTGDCLGAIQQVTEIGIYLIFIILWRFI
jgi:adenosylcobinamide-GDP ribazoletransferase